MIGVTLAQLKGGRYKLRIKFGQRFKDPVGFVSRVMEIYRTAPAETSEVPNRRMETILERFSQTQLLDGNLVGAGSGVFGNVTERKRAQENLRQRRSRAENANQAKDDFWRR